MEQPRTPTHPSLKPVAQWPVAGNRGSRGRPEAIVPFAIGVAGTLVLATFPLLFPRDVAWLGDWLWVVVTLVPSIPGSLAALAVLAVRGWRGEGPSDQPSSVRVAVLASSLVMASGVPVTLFVAFALLWMSGPDFLWIFGAFALGTAGSAWRAFRLYRPANGPPRARIRVPFMLLCLGIGGQAVASFLTRFPRGSIGTMLAVGLLVLGKLYWDRFTTWSRFRWLPVAGSVGLIGGAAALCLEIRTLVRPPFALPEAPLLEAAIRNALVVIPLAGAVAAFALRAELGRRVMLWGARLVGAVALPTLAWLLASHTWSATPSFGRLSELSIFGVASLVLALGLAAVSVPWRHRQRQQAQLSTSGPYRESAPRDVEASQPDDDALLVGRLRWEALAVAVLCMGLAPMLAVAHAGRL